MTKTIVTECVTSGHPDKMADVIADSILDHAVTIDPDTRAGIEVLIKDNNVVLGGEITTKAAIPFDSIVKEVVGDYKFSEEHHLSPDELKITNLIGKQSSEINAGVDQSDGEIGAGDQGFVVGYASNETSSRLPLGVAITRELCNLITRLHESGLGYGPDAKSQVSITYSDNGEATVDYVLVSTMHDRSKDIKQVRKEITEYVRKELYSFYGVIANEYIEDIKIEVNPCGAWNVGGPVSDCGVTGRKIVVDQFGGYANVGGGAFSGKDMTKVDRSGAYLARFIANVIVASGMADNARVELSYMIGVPQPASFSIILDEAHQKNTRLLTEWFRENVDMSPRGIARLFVPYSSGFSFADLARHGHYGTTDTATIYRIVRPWEGELVNNFVEKFRNRDKKKKNQ